MEQLATKIHVGRVVNFFAGYGGIDGRGAIVKVNGTPNPEPPQSIFNGIGRVIRPNDCTLDIILFDGRKFAGVRQCGLDAPGIGFKLLPETIPEAAAAKLYEKAAQKVADDALAATMARQKFEAAEAARVIEGEPPVFFWNGIKDRKGDKLQKCSYSGGELIGCPEGTITIYARDYTRFSAKVRACFAVQNDTDTMVDYFDSDRIRVIPAHPLYPQVKAALQAATDRWNKRRGGA